MDLNKFAYKRRNEYHSQQDFGGNKENCRAENCLQPFTPIKASLTTVPETPEHHLPASPDSISTIQSSTYESGCIRTGRQRKKKCYRLSSSSSEEEDKANDSITPSRHNALFSGLPTSKRRKRTLEDESNNTEVLSVEPRSGEEMRSSINLCSDNGACPELNISVKVCDREKDLNTLHEMFPQYQKSLLKVILCDNDGDLDHAITSLINSPAKDRPPRKRRCRRLRDSDEDSPRSCLTNRLVRHTIDSSDSKRRLSDSVKSRRMQRRQVRIIDSDSSDHSDSDSVSGSVTSSSVNTHDECHHKEIVSSPMWLSARTKLQRYAFQKSDARKSSVGDINERDVLSSNDKEYNAPDRETSLASSSPALATCSSTSLTDSPIKTPQMEPPSTLTTENDGLQSVNDSQTEDDDNSIDDSQDDYSEKQKKDILGYFNGSSRDELCDIPGCSLTKAKLLVKHLPAVKWEDLVDVLISTKGLSEQLLDGCSRLLEERKVLAKLLAKCQAISSSIQGKLMQYKSEEYAKDVVGGQCVPHKQPSILSPSMKLKSYQLIGLNWLALLHSEDLNGILADEMGLGKTVQSISFLAYLYESGHQGPFLIIVPSSTLDNWARELEVWCPQLRVIVYWGSLAERAGMRYEVLYDDDRYNVILSTYSVCIGQVEDRKFLRKLSLQCLVLDEGHMLKNMATQRYGHLMKIKAKRRVLLTGTPLQNNLLELMSLLSFVMPEMFDEYSDYLKKTFSRARKVDESSAYYKEQVSQAKQIMQPFTLRRLKSEVMCDLPKKDDSVEYCPLTELQQQLYDQLVQKSKVRINKKNELDEQSKSLSIIMEMRKIANHPLLVRHHYSDDILRQMSQDILREPSHRDADPELVYEDMTVMTDFELHRLSVSYPVLKRHCLPQPALVESGKMNFLASKLDELTRKGDRALLFSQFTMMLDILEVFLQHQNLAYLRLDGQTSINERQNLIDTFNKNSNFLVFLLSTKAGGLGINLTSANVVIIHDIDFNPYNDKQAEDRCHRMGQNKEVKVIRLVSKSTIEEEMLHNAQMKLQLEKDITNTEGVAAVDMVSLLKQGLGLIPDTDQKT